MVLLSLVLLLRLVVTMQSSNHRRHPPLLLLLHREQMPPPVASVAIVARIEREPILQATEQHLRLQLRRQVALEVCCKVYSVDY